MIVDVNSFFHFINLLNILCTLTIYEYSTVAADVVSQICVVRSNEEKKKKKFNAHSVVINEGHMAILLRPGATSLKVCYDEASL